MRRIVLAGIIGITMLGLGVGAWAQGQPGSSGVQPGMMGSMMGPGMMGMGMMGMGSGQSGTQGMPGMMNACMAPQPPSR